MQADTFIFDDDLAPYMSDRAAGPATEPGFDEAAYLKANPAVVEALAKKEIPSALYHYRVHGKKTAAAPAAPAPAEPAPVANGKPSANNVDTIFLSHSGAVFVVGWADDQDNPIRRIRVSNAAGAVDIGGPQLTRYRRRDVEAAMSADGSRSF